MERWRMNIDRLPELLYEMYTVFWKEYKRRYPELTRKITSFLGDLKARGEKTLTVSNIGHFFVDIAAPYVAHFASNIQEDTYTRNMALLYSNQLKRHGMFLDFIPYLAMFGDLCLKNEAKMRDCFSILVKYEIV